jgi:hypothetical protein
MPEADGDRELLVSIARLRQALSETATLEDTATWWELYVGLETDLNADPHATGYERSMLRELRDGLSDAIQVIREGRQTPRFLGKASVALTYLEDSIKRRSSCG